MKLFSNLIFFLLLVACNDSGASQEHEAGVSQILNSAGKNIHKRFQPPEKYHRMAYDSNSFAFYLRNLPLKPHGEEVHYYDGRKKRNSWVAEAVIDISVGQKDLQQCADAVIRLRAEYLRRSGREEDIVFNFTNGSPASWSKWKDGYRSYVSGNELSWKRTAEPSETEKSFQQYLETVFMYAGSLSLEKELIPAGLEDIQAGYVFIRGGSPGHAVIVVDVVVDDRGKKLFMLAQSYMPAQDIHILANPNDEKISPWYRLSENEDLVTPEWTFKPGALKRFP